MADEKRIDQLAKTLTTLSPGDRLVVQDISDNETAQIAVEHVRAALASSLQQAYDTGAAPEIETTRGALTVTTPGLTPAITVRADLGGVVYEGPSLTVGGMSSPNPIQIRPQDAPSGESGAKVSLLGGDAPSGAGGDVVIDAGAGAPGGEVSIGGGSASAIKSGIGTTNWLHSGSLTVQSDVELTNGNLSLGADQHVAAGRMKLEATGSPEPDAEYNRLILYTRSPDGGTGLYARDDYGGIHSLTLPQPPVFEEGLVVEVSPYVHDRRLVCCVAAGETEIHAYALDPVGPGLRARYVALGGTLKVVAGGGVTLRMKPGVVAETVQDGVIQLEYLTHNQVLVTGDLNAAP